MTEEIRESYRLLEVEPGAPLDAVKGAYRELIKIWHPDRFPNDPKFQKRATEKTKALTKLTKKSQLIWLAIILNHAPAPEQGPHRRKRREQEKQRRQANAKKR